MTVISLWMAFGLPLSMDIRSLTMVLLSLWDPGGVKGAWTLHEARLDEKSIVFAVAVLILPMADRVPAKGWLDLALLGPRAAIGIDATRIMDVLDQHVDGFRGE